MLATEPKHQHNGAGTMLLEEILAEADDAGVEAYLEATDTAKPLYERHGFQSITELRFSPAEYGTKGLGIERQTVMVRGALGSDGERQPVRSWDVAVAHAKGDLQQ
jgi:GNAT superfamily N-acetyltransferase